MQTLQRITHALLRFLLFLVPITALLVLGFVIVSFVGAQLADAPQGEKVALLRPTTEQPLNLSPANLELRLVGFYLRLQNQALQTPAGSDATLRPFKIVSGETAVTVSERLQEQGLITDANLFRLYMRYYGIDQRLAAGDFEVAPSMTMGRIAETLQRSRIQEISVTIPEGLRAEEVADLLNVQGIMDGDAFLALVRGGSASARAMGDYPFLSDSLTTLEGYLFPDTYRLPARASRLTWSSACWTTSSLRVTDDVLAPARAAGRDLTQVIIMASIVEREARAPTSGRSSPASTGTGSAARAARRPAAPISRPIRPSSMRPAKPASGGGSRRRWRRTRRFSRPTTPTCAPDCRLRRSPVQASRPSRRRRSPRRRATASSWRRATGRTSSP